MVASVPDDGGFPAGGATVASVVLVVVVVVPFAVVVPFGRFRENNGNLDQKPAAAAVSLGVALTQ